MKKIIFDFEGKVLNIESCINLVTLIANGNTMFRFNDEDYIIVDKTLFGLEQQAINDALTEELRKVPDYNGDYPDDVLELHVKLKKA